MKDPVLAYLEGGAQRAAGNPGEWIERLHSDPDLVARLVFHLNGTDSRIRSGAASALAEVADKVADDLAGHVPDLVLALEQEEVTTRLGAMRTLAAVARHRPDALDEDFDTIRLGLFDPTNAEIRSAAAEAIACFGSRDTISGRRAFPHLAEALRRFHDQERSADLIRNLAWLAGNSIDPSLKDDIWRAVRRHDRHPDPAVRAVVEETRVICSDRQ